MKHFLHKSLTKVFLIMVLFLSGCTISTDLIDSIRGQKGTYSAKGVDYTFTISDDGLIYTNYCVDEDNNKLEKYKLGYLSSNGTDCITFKRFYDDGTVIIVILSDITSLNGIHTLYEDYINTQSGFAWDTDIRI